MSTLGYILVGLGGVGVIGEGIYSCITEKLTSTDLGLKIFMPTFIFLLLIILGMYMIFKNDLVNGINSDMFYPLIVFMASGSIAFSSIVIVFSELVVKWKSN
jgi:hypothetical protein